MEKQYYLPDIENGTMYACTKEYYELFMKIWNSCSPSIQGIGTPIILGTAGEIENNSKEIFFNTK